MAEANRVVSEKNDALIHDTAERNGADKFWVAETVICSDGYKVKIDSAVGEKEAAKVWIEDTLAISKLNGK